MAERSRTYHWPDPAALREAAMASTGMEFISGLMSGGVAAPIGATIDMKGVEEKEEIGRAHV